MGRTVNPKSNSAWTRLVNSLERWVATEEGLLTLIWALRFVALLWLTRYFVAQQRSHTEFMQLQIQIALLVFFAYVVVSGAGGTYYPEQALSRRVELIQVVFEVILYSVFYYLTQDSRSEVYLLYFLPLFTAVRYLGPQLVVGILGLASLSLYVVLAFIDRSSIMDIYLPRELFMLAMTLFFVYALRRRPPVLEDIQEEKFQLISALKGFTDGVYVVDKERLLLFVNDVLQTRHGTYTPGQTCSSYFMCQDRSCGWCPPTGSFADPYTDIQKQEGTFIDQEGHPYRVEVSSCPLPDESRQTVGAIVFVRDVSRQKGIEQRLEEHLRMITRQVQGLATERAKWLETYSELAKRLAGFSDLEDLMQFVVNETRERLNAETSALFLLENNRLVRRATAGIESGWFSEESYRVGEGITGLAMVSENGAKYGKPVLVNEVDENPSVIPLHLTKYREKLGTHEVKHLIAVPLNGQERSFGVLRVVNRLDSQGQLSVEGFQPEDVDFLVTIASIVSVAMENARLIQTEQEKRHLADTLCEVSRVANSSLNLGEVLQHILNELGKVVAYDSASIQLLEGNQLHIIASRGFDEPDAVKKIAFPVDDPKFPNHEVVVTRKPYIMDDVHLHYPHFFEEGEKYYSTHIRSWLGIPLLYRDRVIGMLSLEKEVPNSYTDDHAPLALTFANQVAIAIENARLFEETQQQVEELDRLYQASQVVTSSLDILEVLKNIVSLAGEVADSDHTGVVLVGEDGSLTTSVEDHEVGVPLHIRARPNGIARRVINTAESVIFNAVQDDGVTHNPAVIQQGFRSYAGVPIIARGKVQGVLFVHSFKPGAFQGREALLHTFCNQAAIAIENARLFRERENQAAMLATLVQASSRLIEHTSLEELYRFCAESGAIIFAVEDCSLYVKSEERRTIDLVASSGIPTYVWTRRETLINAPGLTAYVARSGETLNFRGDEFKEHPAWAGHHGEPFLEHLRHLPSQRCHSLLMGPLVDSKGYCVGVLKLENKRGEGAGKRFSAFEVALFRTFASHIGIAIERARLYHRLDEEARRRARESLSDDLHDIMNVLHGTLLLGTAYTKELMDIENYDAVRSQLDKMAKAARSIYGNLRLIHQDIRDPVLEEKGLVPALKHYAEILQIPVTFRIAGRVSIPPEVEYALYKIAQEALNNVTRHAGLREQGGNAEVTLEKTAESFQLTVRDNGVGFDPEATLNRDDTFGLQSMRRWAESIGARLEISSQRGKGASVRISGHLKEVPNERHN